MHSWFTMILSNNSTASALPHIMNYIFDYSSLPQHQFSHIHVDSLYILKPFGGMMTPPLPCIMACALSLKVVNSIAYKTTMINL